MKNVFRLLSLVVALLVGLGAALPAMAAGSSGPGTITALYTMPNGAVLVNVNVALSGSPSCATSPQRWAVDSTTTVGKTMASNLALAFALGKTISVTGTGTCVAWADTENISFFVINP